MKSIVMAMLLATVSVGGEVRFQAAQPISADRVGVAGVSQHSWLAEGGDDTFLFVWQDDRDSWPRFASRGFLAARVSADGTLLDEVPLSLPMWVEAVTRANDGWIAVGYRSIIRISDEGTVSEVKPVPHPGIPFVTFELKGAAWTGQAVVVLYTSYTRSSSGALIGAAAAMSFDADL